MSIRLLSAIFVAGVLSPADGSTISLSPALEADLVNQGKAVWVSAPALTRNNYDNFGSTLTWAQLSALSAAAYAGMQVYVSDVGVGGSFWYSAGDKWRPIGGRVTLKNTLTDIQNTGAAKVVLDYATLPAGLFADGDMIETSWNLEKVGTGDTSGTDIALGTVAGTPGTSLAVNTNALATTTLTLATNHLFRKESATSIRPETLATSSAIGGSTNAGVVVTVPDMSSQTTYLQLTSDMTAGTDVIHLRGFLVTLICGS